MNDRDRRLGFAAGAVALATLAVAVVPPPEGLDGPAGGTRMFAALASAAVVALAVIPGAVGRTAWRRPLWTGIAVLSLAAGLAAFALSGSVQRTCTARYDGRARMVGTEWTPLGERYTASNPGLSKDELLFDSAGVADRLWTQASISRCRTLVGGTYFLWIPLLVVCLFASLKAAPSGTLPMGLRGTAAAPPAPGAVFRYDVFISYRHGGRDGVFARELLSALEGAGYAVAIDERDFPANASFLQEMERCIRESRYTVAVISPRYLGSGHCEEEAIVCKVLDMGDRRRRLIPLIIETVPLPAWLFGIVGIDSTAADPLVEPFEKLRSTLGPPLSRRPAGP